MPDKKLIPAFKRLPGFMKADACDDAAVNQVKEAPANLIQDRGRPGTPASS